MKKILSAILVMTVLFSSMFGTVVVNAASSIPIDEQFTATDVSELPLTVSGGAFVGLLSSGDEGYPDGASGKVLKISGGTDGGNVEYPYNTVSSESVGFEIRFYWPDIVNFNIGFENSLAKLTFDRQYNCAYHYYDKSNQVNGIEGGWNQIKMVSVCDNTDNIYKTFLLYKWDGTQYVFLMEYTARYQTVTSLDDLHIDLPTGSDLYIDWIKINRAYDAPSTPVWNGKVLNWTGTGNNITGYDVVLFKDGTQVATASTSSASYDFTNAMSLKGSGTYTAKVVTKGTYAWDSPYSAESVANVVTVDTWPMIEDFSIYQTNVTKKGNVAPFSEGANTDWMVIAPGATDYPAGAEGNVLRIDGASEKMYYTLPASVTGQNVSYEVRFYWPSDDSDYWPTNGQFNIGFGDNLARLYFKSQYSVANNDSQQKEIGGVGAGWHQFKFVNVYADSATGYTTFDVYRWNGRGYELLHSGYTPRYSSGVTSTSKLVFEIPVDGTLYVDWIRVNAYIPTAPAIPASPVFDSGYISWEAVDNANGYDVTIFRNENEIASYTGIFGTSVYADAAIYDAALNGSGSYTAKVRAVCDTLKSEYSPASAVFSVDCADYKRIDSVIDFEDKVAGTILTGDTDTNTATVKAQGDITGGVTGNALEIIQDETGDPVYLKKAASLSIPALNADAIGVCVDVYVPDETQVTLWMDGRDGSNGAPVIANVVFRNGSYLYHNGSATIAFESGATVHTGRNTIEIIMKKEAEGTYALAEYYLNGTKLSTGENQTIRHTGATAFSDIRIAGTGAYIDNIVFYDYDEETRAVLAQPTDVSFADGKLSFAEAQGVAHTAYLYRGGKIYSTKIVPAGTTEVDFSAEIAAGGTRALYSAGVCAKGDWTATVSSAEVAASETMHGEGYPYEFTKYVMKNGNKVTVRGTVSRINNNAGTDLAMLLSAYDGEKLADVDIKDIEADTLASLGASEILSLTVDLTDIAVPSIKLLTFESLTNPIPLNAMEPIAIPQ